MRNSLTRIRGLPTASNGEVVPPTLSNNRRVIGFVPAHPFMRPAWDKHRERVAPRIGRFIWVALQKRARRLASQ